MRITRALAAGLALAITAAALAACSGTPTASEEEEKVLRVALPFGDLGWDPTAAFQAPYGVLPGAVYDGLFAEREGLRIDPWVAEEFSYNEGNTVLSITLRDDVDYVDGVHLNAETVKAVLDYVRMPDKVNAPFFAAISDVVVTGEYTLELRLSHADSEFLHSLACIALASPNAVDNPDLFNDGPVGSGPYVIEDMVSGVSYSLVRNPDYWNAEAFPYDRVEITILSDLTARVNALKSGQVDVADIDGSTAADVESAGFEVSHANLSWAGLIIGDRRGEISPPLADVRVRRAISMAMDRVGFANAVDGPYGDPSNQRGVAGQDGFYVADRVDDYAYDINDAKALLTDAGYPDGFDITIPYDGGTEAYDLPYFQQAFKDLGIRVNWVKLIDDEVISEFKSGDYPILPFQAAYADMSLIRPDGQWNPWGNDDAETDSLLSQISGGSQDEAAIGQAGLTAKILDEAWFAILAHPPTVWASTKDVVVTKTDYGWTNLLTIHPAS